jgi:hypothetical protein
MVGRIFPSPGSKAQAPSPKLVTSELTFFSPVAPFVTCSLKFGIYLVSCFLFLVSSPTTPNSQQFCLLYFPEQDSIMLN